MNRLRTAGAASVQPSRALIGLTTAVAWRHRHTCVDSATPGPLLARTVAT